MALRTRVYVDGFNLYYGAVKNTPFRWLNPVELMRHVLPAQHTLDRVLYFTARVSGIPDPRAPARQHAYISALRTLPQIEVHFGSFLAKTIWRPLVNLPVAGRQIHTRAPVTLPSGNHTVSGSPTQTLPVGAYPATGTGNRRRRGSSAPLPDAVVAESHTLEEKGSDVNLASHLLNDAWKGLFDVAAVISNDTDLVTPIRMVTAEQGKSVIVVCPGRWQTASRLRSVASGVRHIRRSMLQAAQFPDPIPGTAISKPASW